MSMMRAVGKTLIKANLNVAIFIFAFLIGFGVCWVSYWLCHKIFFKTSKLNKTLLYSYCIIGGIVWGFIAVNNL